MSNNPKARIERLSLKETRNKYFDKFRRNLRILRASMDISAVDLSKKIKLKNGKRCIDLEYGRGNPTTEELIAITNYFKITLDDILNKDAKISFQP